MALDLATLAYVQAANQGGVRSETSLFVIHSAECP